MKKWKKIQKSLIRKWRQTQCDWFGHQPVTVIEERWRGKQNLLNAFGVGSISYRSQCLLVEQAGDGNGATNYVPDWVDMFEKDWFVLGGE